MNRITSMALTVGFATALSITAAPAPAAQPAARDTSLSASKPSAQHPHKVRQLAAKVGPGFTISMSKSRTRAGVYDITVTDRSTQHNFHLTGPGVNKKTKITTTTTKVWHVRLTVGTYRFVCDAHPDMMKGRIKVVARP